VDIQPAIDWIEKHSDDPDYEEQLFIVSDISNKKVESKFPKLSKQEAKELAKEL